jgi:hypothetical protein
VRINGRPHFVVDVTPENFAGTMTMFGPLIALWTE